MNSRQAINRELLRAWDAAVAEWRGAGARDYYTDAEQIPRLVRWIDLNACNHPAHLPDSVYIVGPMAVAHGA